MNENIDIRVPLHFGSHNYKSTEGGTTIDGKVTYESVGVMLDYYPSDSGFRISGGLAAGGYHFDAYTASLEFDRTTYTRQAPREGVAALGRWLNVLTLLRCLVQAENARARSRGV